MLRGTFTLKIAAIPMAIRTEAAKYATQGSML